MKRDTMTVEILDDGIIKITSADKISAPNHVNAEKMVAAITKDAGGPVTIKRLSHSHSHAHGHTHEH